MSLGYVLWSRFQHTYMRSRVVVRYIMCVSHDVFLFQAEDGIRDLVRSRGLGDVYKRQAFALARCPTAARKASDLPSGDQQMAAVEPMVEELNSRGVAVRFPDDLKPGSTIYLNDLMADTTILTTPSGLNAVPVILPPFGSKVFTVSMTPDTLKVLHPVTEVRIRDAVPGEFAVYPNFPNPFNPSTSIHYSIPTSGPLSLRVYDLLGTLVRTLVDEQCEAGGYTVDFDAADLPSGTYIYKLAFDGATLTRRMTLMK